jgi:hypothetical protein
MWAGFALFDGAVLALFALLSTTTPSIYHRNASTQLCTRLHFAPAANPAGARVCRPSPEMHPRSHRPAPSLLR